MKILLIHQYFWTPQEGGGLRSYYLASELIRQGFSVVVITSTNKPKSYSITYEGIEVHYIPVQYKNEFGFLRRIFAFALFAWRSRKLATRFSDVKLVYAMSVPLTIGWTAMQLKRYYNIPFVFEVGDLWPDAPIELGFIKNSLLISALRMFERKIYNEALSVIGLSEDIARAIENRSDKKVAVIPNFSDVNFFSVKHRSTKRPFVISYVGSVGYANGLDYFLDCAVKAQKHHADIIFKICGEGALLPVMKQRRNALKLTNLEFIDHQNKDGVKKVLDDSDASFISFLPFKILETGSPNKYFDGLAAGKLIIVNFKGWVKEEILKYECGIALDPSNPGDFLNKLAPFLTDDELLRKYQANARNLAEQFYSREILGNRLSEHLRKVLGVE